MAQQNLSISWNMQVVAATAISSTHVTVSDLLQGVNYGTTMLLTAQSTSQGMYAGASGENNAALACRTGSLNRSATGSSYFSFTVAANTGYHFLLQSISLGLRSTSSGPQAWCIYSSIDNFTTPLLTSTLVNNSNWVFQEHLINSNYYTSAEYRLYGYNGVGTAAINVANWRIDDLQLTGLIAPVTLPVHWLYTVLSTFQDCVKLAWATAWEQNNLRYHIERSKDGNSFLKIGEIITPAVELVNDKQVYYFLDHTPLSGRSYYRIVQEDKDGTLNYGAVRSIFYDAFPAFFMLGYRFDFSTNQFILHCKGGGATTFQLFTIDGKLVGHYSKELVSGSPHTFLFPISVRLIYKAPLVLVVIQKNKRVLSRLISYN